MQNFPKNLYFLLPNTHTYLGNISFPENFKYVLNKGSLTLNVVARSFDLTYLDDEIDLQIVSTLATIMIFSVFKAMLSADGK